MEKREQEEFFHKNINLAYKIANRYRYNYFYEMEDIKQIALCALWKAVIKYEEDKAKFSSFAVAIISNDINQHLRKVKKKKDIISFSSPIRNGEDITLEDILTDDSENEFEKIENRLLIRNTFSKMPLNDKDKIILKHWLDGEKQIDIAKKMNMSQANVSRYIIRLKRRLKIPKNKNI